MLKKLMQSIREYKLPSILTFIFILLEAVIECIIPYITANLVNAVEDGAELSAVMKTGGVLIAMAVCSLSCGGIAGFVREKIAQG